MAMKNEEGQGLTEYILLLAIVASGYLLLVKGMSRIGLAQKLMTPLTQDFASAYRYGHPKAKGFDDPGGPEKHPRIEGGKDGFRIFINPK